MFREASASSNGVTLGLRSIGLALRKVDNLSMTSSLSLSSGLSIMCDDFYDLHFLMNINLVLSFGVGVNL